MGPHCTTKQVNIYVCLFACLLACWLAPPTYYKFQVSTFEYSVFHFSLARKRMKGCCQPAACTVRVVLPVCLVKFFNSDILKYVYAMVSCAVSVNVRIYRLESAQLSACMQCGMLELGWAMNYVHSSDFERR